MLHSTNLVDKQIYAKVGLKNGEKNGVYTNIHEYFRMRFFVQDYVNMAVPRYEVNLIKRW